MEFFNSTKFMKTGKYNGYSIVFFHGHNHSAFNYNYIYENDIRKRKCYFLDYLAQLSTLFIYNRPEEMFRFNKEQGENTNMSMYSQIVKKTNVEWHCKNLCEFLERCKVKPPYVLVAHSIGSLYALKFAKMFSTKIQQVFILDPPQFTPYIAKKYFSNKLSKKDISNFIQKLIKNPDNYKIIQKLDFHTESIPYFTPKLNGPLYCFFNIVTDSDNKLIYEFNELLKKINPDNYQPLFYKNRDHYLNETNPLGIVNKIKKYIESKQ